MMGERTVKISPKGFWVLKKTLMDTELEGHHPDDCARMALNSVGLSWVKHPPGQPIKFVVDYLLLGSIYPFKLKDTDS